MRLFFLVLLLVFVLSVKDFQKPVALEIESEESSFLTLINNYRAQNNLNLLILDEQLNVVAQWMANDMAANNYFSHTDSLGRDPFTRMNELGYTYNTFRGENLVTGTESAQGAFNLWQASVGHNANMLSSSYVSIGIALAYNAESSFGWYWATEFGGLIYTPPPTPNPIQISTAIPTQVLTPTPTLICN
jgi:uncharacterized protein YkwD